MKTDGRVGPGTDLLFTAPASLVFVPLLRDRERGIAVGAELPDTDLLRGHGNTGSADLASVFRRIEFLPAQACIGRTVIDFVQAAFPGGAAVGKTL